MVAPPLTFPSSEVLLVLDGVCQRGHDVLLFERQDAQAFDQPSQAVRRSFPLRVLVTLQQQLQQIPDDSCCVLLDGRNQRRQAASHGLLDLREKTNA